MRKLTIRLTDTQALSIKAEATVRGVSLAQVVRERLGPEKVGVVLTHVGKDKLGIVKLLQNLTGSLYISKEIYNKVQRGIPSPLSTHGVTLDEGDEIGLRFAKLDSRVELVPLSELPHTEEPAARLVLAHVGPDRAACAELLNTLIPHSTTHQVLDLMSSADRGKPQDFFPFPLPRHKAEAIREKFEVFGHQVKLLDANPETEG